MQSSEMGSSNEQGAYDSGDSFRARDFAEVVCA